MGEYDDSRQDTISAHLKMSRQGNIRLWVSSWFGPDHPTDRTMRNTILTHPELHQQQLVIHYETNNRLWNKAKGAYDTRNVVADIKHLCQHYFKHPNYYRNKGTVMMVVYLTRTIDNAGAGGYAEPHRFLEETLRLMRTTALSTCNEKLWIVGDQIFNTYDKVRDEPSMKLLDAISG